jgi:hypothetical protein
MNEDDHPFIFGVFFWGWPSSYASCFWLPQGPQWLVQRFVPLGELTRVHLVYVSATPPISINQVSCLQLMPFEYLWMAWAIPVQACTGSKAWYNHNIINTNQQLASIARMPCANLLRPMRHIWAALGCANLRKWGVLSTGGRKLIPPRGSPSDCT